MIPYTQTNEVAAIYPDKWLNLFVLHFVLELQGKGLTMLRDSLGIWSKGAIFPFADQNQLLAFVMLQALQTIGAETHIIWPHEEQSSIFILTNGFRTTLLHIAEISAADLLTFRDVCLAVEGRVKMLLVKGYNVNWPTRLPNMHAILRCHFTGISWHMDLPMIRKAEKFIRMQWLVGQPCWRPPSWLPLPRAMRSRMKPRGWPSHVMQRINKQILGNETWTWKILHL